MTYNKYSVAPKSQRTIGTTVYASKKEKDYKIRLELLKSAKNASERVVSIAEQVPFDIIVNEVKICRYVLDFKVTYADGRIEYVDIKGFKGGIAYNVFKIKKKLMMVCHGIDVIEK